jgi:proline iminopeptidase
MRWLTLLAFVAAGCVSGPPVSEVLIPTAGTVKSGVFDLEYKIEGRGPTAIVIGYPDYYAKAFSEDLRSHLKLVFIDHRGSAASPGKVDNAEFSIKRLVDDIELIRSRLNLGEVIVIGHSGHSYLALEYAKTYPEHVSHTVMVAISPRFDGDSYMQSLEYWEETASEERKAAWDRNQAALPDEELESMNPDERFAATYIRNGPKYWYDYDFDASPLWEGISVNSQMMAHVWGELFPKLDNLQGLENLQSPVFLALGRHDFALAPPAAWDEVKGSFDDITIGIFEESGHSPNFEEPKAFDLALMRWLELKNQQ